MHKGVGTGEGAAGPSPPPPNNFVGGQNSLWPLKKFVLIDINEPVHEISNNVVCATIKGSDQPAHMHSLIRAFACRLNIL